jgi:hypothetical protein
MRIAAFDLANVTGWAIAEDGAVVESGVLELALGEEEHPGERWSRARKALAKVACNAEVIAWERVIGRFRNASILYVLEAMLVEQAWEASAETITIVPSSLKLYAAGSGRAQNPEVLAAAQRKWPRHAFKTHDEAHARFVATWALEQLKEKVHG